MPLVTFKQQDQLGEIVIDNPPLNLFNANVLSDLRSAVDQAAHSDIRAVLVRAEGSDFSAGADVSVFTDLDQAGANELEETVLSLIAAIEAPYAGGTQRIASRIGASRAAEMVFTGAVLPPQTLASWGLINRVVPADRLTEEGRAFAQNLANGPTRAHAVTKRVLHAWRSGGVAAADLVTRAEGPTIMMSEDLRDGLASLARAGIGHATFHNR